MGVALDPDLVDTARNRPCTVRCSDCSVLICEGTTCLSCTDTRRLLPRFLSLVRGRAHVRALLAEIDDLDGALSDETAPGG